METKKQGKLSRMFKGFSGVFTSYAFLTKHKLWRYVILPIIITIGIAFALKITIILSLQVFIKGKITGIIAPYLTYPVISWIAGLLSYVISAVAAYLIIIVLYTFIGSIIWSIFSGPLQNRVEKIMTGKTTEVKGSIVLKWTIIGIMDAILNLFLLLLVTLASFLFLLIPIIGFILQSITVILFSAYLVGRSNFRVTAELYETKRSERNQSAKRFKAESTGQGLPEIIGTFIPLFDIIVVFLLWAGGITSAMITYQETKKTVTNQRVFLGKTM